MIALTLLLPCVIRNLRPDDRVVVTDERTGRRLLDYMADSVMVVENGLQLVIFGECYATPDGVCVDIVRMTEMSNLRLRRAVVTCRHVDVEWSCA